jgi:hypothetical protein
MISDTCPCGGTATEPNRDCERCRLVYVVRAVERMRSAQRQYHAGRSGELLRVALEAEKLVDRLLSRLNEIQPALFDADDDAGDSFPNPKTDRHP